jgi:hypothetical protein
VVGSGKAAPGSLDGRGARTRADAEDVMGIALRHIPSLATGGQSPGDAQPARENGAVDR